MAKKYDLEEVMRATAAASELLNSRKEEINRLNVFPVPDGDTGTNMSLTMKSVVDNVRELPPDSTPKEYRKAVITGALMGARGNSGVITSQILRGLCEGSEDTKEFDTDSLAKAFAKAEEVAFQAVRKPVQGTILTVLHDCAAEAAQARDANLSIDNAMDAVVNEAFASVERTPDFLPVLKENNVVDAGAYGLAIIFEGFSAYLQGKLPNEIERVAMTDLEPRVEIEHIDDWEGSEYRYCNEFLVDSDELDTVDALQFLSTMGDCELCVGSKPKFKVHVHSNHPDQVLKYFLDRGQVSEVFIHNMDLQSKDRAKRIAEEQAKEGSGEGAGSVSVVSEDVVTAPSASDPKAIGYVAVATGEGNADILRSLGVDVVVSGGQTMNPSTKDLLQAIGEVDAEGVIILPNNSNIIMTANTACELADKDCRVVPTKSVPDAISAMFVADEEASLDENRDAMEEALADVRTGEVTTAVKTSKDKHGNPIEAGDVIGVADGEIEVVGSDVADVTMALIDAMDADDGDNITILAGEDMTRKALDDLVARIEEAHPDLDTDAHMGGQPLYPVILSIE